HNRDNRSPTPIEGAGEHAEIRGGRDDVRLWHVLDRRRTWRSMARQRLGALGFGAGFFGMWPRFGGNGAPPLDASSLMNIFLEVLRELGSMFFGAPRMAAPLLVLIAIAAAV